MVVEVAPRLLLLLLLDLCGIRVQSPTSVEATTTLLLRLRLLASEAVIK